MQQKNIFKILFLTVLMSIMGVNEMKAMFNWPQTVYTNGVESEVGGQIDRSWNGTTYYLLARNTTHYHFDHWVITYGSTSTTHTGYQYEFTGYNVAENCPDDVKAYFVGDSYTNTLAYDANGGSGAPEAQTGSVTYPNTTYSFTVSTTKPTRLGYVFLGWATSSTATEVEYAPGSSITVGTASTADNQSATLYAVWQALKTKDVDGTTYYQLGTADELLSYRDLAATATTETKTAYNAQLTANIVVNESVLNSDGTLNGTPTQQWVAPERFYGIFDGQGYTISGLYSTGTSYVGLVGSNYGTIKNLGILDSYFQGTDSYIGTFAGQSNSGIITNCYSLSTVSGGSSCGGIVGMNEGSTASNCYFAGHMIGCNNSSSSPIAYSGTITNCYYLETSKLDNQSTTGCTSFTTAQMASGELAYTMNGSKTTDQTWFQTIGTDANPVLISTGSNIVYYGYANCEATAQTYNNTAMLESPGHNYVDRICTKTPGQTHYYPVTPSSGVYYLADKIDLMWFASKVNSTSGSYTAKLTSDIDMTGITNYTPIGTETLPFNGTFDGQGHRIKNLAITGESCAGLIGHIGGYNGNYYNIYIKNVIMDSSCSVTSTGTGVAGLVGCARGSKVTSGHYYYVYVYIQNCGNEAAITGNGDVGGIFGGSYVDDNIYLNVTNCYNTGAITGTSNAAALCGYTRYNYAINHCYNSGTVTGVEGTKYLYRYGNSKDTPYCYDVNGPQSGVTLITAEQVKNGELCAMLNTDGNKFAQTTLVDSHPVPGTGGLIDPCQISSASDLTRFATYVNQGIDFSNSTVYLKNDIDMSGVTNFPLIGCKAYPYRGTFDGQRHRIKNLAITGEDYTGFFAYVGGYNKSVTANIKNVIIDSSCSNTSTGTAAAGLIGGVTSTSLYTCNITVENCGNEANITANKNVGGIIGGVYNNDQTTITIKNCYNTGAITGTTESAAICGYARKNYTFTNCYNSGEVTGASDGQHFFRLEDTGSKSVTNCYDIVGTQVTQITAAKVATGELCQTLNSNRDTYSAWTQDLGESNSYPTFGTAGLHYTRTMANQWGTICLPFAAATSDDYDFYELSAVSGTTLTLSKVTTPEAGKPYIIRRSGSVTDVDVTASGTTFAETAGTGTEVGGLTLTGAFTSTDITSEDGYVIANNSFWNIAAIKGENKVSCAPFHAYLAGTVSSAKMLTIGFGDDTSTAVETINAITTGTAEYYDLNGHKLNDLQQGVNILKFKNGTTKKVIIK